MAFTTAELEAMRDALKVALAKGEQTVVFADRSVTYRSVDQILRALAAVEAGLAAMADPPRPRQWAVYSSKGFDT